MEVSRSTEWTGVRERLGRPPHKVWSEARQRRRGPRTTADAAVPAPNPEGRGRATASPFFSDLLKSQVSRWVKCPHIPGMFDDSEFDRWRGEAGQAAKAARLQADAGLHNWACFLAEQAAQLAVKGLLHGVGRGAWGHDLVALGERLAEALEMPAPQTVLAAFQRLSRHYIPARYPDAHPSGTAGGHYGEQDVRDALGDLDSVLEYVDDRWRALEEGED